MNSVSKTLALLITTALIFNALLGCGSNRKNFDELIGNSDDVRTYEVFGMDCPGCHGGLENLVNKVTGVLASKANWEKQELRVAIKSGADVSDEAIYEAIKEANFTHGKRLE